MNRKIIVVFCLLVSLSNSAFSSSNAQKALEEQRWNLQVFSMQAGMLVTLGLLAQRPLACLSPFARQALNVLIVSAASRWIIVEFGNQMSLLNKAWEDVKQEFK